MIKTEMHVTEGDTRWVLSDGEEMAEIYKAHLDELYVVEDDTCRRLVPGNDFARAHECALRMLQGAVDIGEWIAEGDVGESVKKDAEAWRRTIEDEYGVWQLFVEESESSDRVVWFVRLNDANLKHGGANRLDDAMMRCEKAWRECIPRWIAPEADETTDEPGYMRCMWKISSYEDVRPDGNGVLRWKWECHFAKPDGSMVLAGAGYKDSQESAILAAKEALRGRGVPA